VPVVGDGDGETHLREILDKMTKQELGVLFLCTGNSARSIMAEAILNRQGAGRFRAYSAGSHPAGHVNPFALELLRRQGLPIADLRSKSWDEFAAPGAPRIDFIFTLCDSAAGETCPVWPGHPARAHWGIEDPAAVGGSDEDKRRAFARAFQFVNRRISLFTSLRLDKLMGESLQSELDTIGRLREKGE
jgi:arsenate reductase